MVKAKPVPEEEIPKVKVSSESGAADQIEVPECQKQPGAAKPGILQKLKKPKDSKQAKIDELTDTLKRVQAEFENYKKRVDRDKEEFVKFAEKELIAKLLPVLDNFELALKNKDKIQDFIKGVELIYSELFSLMEKEGIKPIEAEGKKFDPELHEALLSEKSDKEENTVLEEMQKGYLFRDKVLRTAKVKVSRK